MERLMNKAHLFEQIRFQKLLVRKMEESEANPKLIYMARCIHASLQKLWNVEKRRLKIQKEREANASC
jgi:hypothetical protein